MNVSIKYILSIILFTNSKDNKKVNYNINYILLILLYNSFTNHLCHRCVVFDENKTQLTKTNKTKKMFHLNYYVFVENFINTNIIIINIIAMIKCLKYILIIECMKNIITIIG